MLLRSSFMGLAFPRSDRPPALDHPDEHGDDRKDEQQVDETAHGVRADQPERPERDEDDTRIDIVPSKCGRLLLPAGVSFSGSLSSPCAAGPRVKAVDVTRSRDRAACSDVFASVRGAFAIPGRLL